MHPVIDASVCTKYLFSPCHSSPPGYPVIQCRFSPPHPCLTALVSAFIRESFLPKFPTSQHSVSIKESLGFWGGVMEFEWFFDCDSQRKENNAESNLTTMFEAHLASEGKRQ